MSVLWLKAIRDVTKRRVRSLLTLAGIVIGVAGMVAIVSTAQNLAHAQEAAYHNASQADVEFWVWDAPPATERALAAVDDVTDAELRNNFFTRCQWNGVWRDVYLIAFADYDHARINRIFLRAGRYPQPGEFVAEASVRAVFDARAGDTLTCRAREGGMGRALSLVGFAQTPNYPASNLLEYVTVYASASDVRKLLGISGANQALIKIRDTSRARATADALAKILDRRGISHGRADIRDPANFLGKRELDALLLLLSVFSVVGLITSGFLVGNTLAAIAAEQVGEIGAVKAVGGTRGQILGAYLISALVYGIGGTALGLGVGVVASWQLLAYIGSLLNLDTGFIVSPEALALGAVVGLGVTIFSGAIPSIRATAIGVKDALEAYDISSSYGRGWVDRAVNKIIALPPLAAMSLRNLARRKGRSFATIAVIAVAVAASLAAQSASASVSNAIDALFQTYRADAWVWLGEWVGTTFAGNLRAAPGVTDAEVWSLQDVQVSKSQISNLESQETTRARLWGLPADTRLYQPRIVEGRWMRADENDTCVISTDLAQNLRLEIGDWIEVETGDERRSFRVVGLAIDNSVFLGSTVAGKVFLRDDLVAMMQRHEGWAYFFAIAFDRHDLQSVEARMGELSTKFRGYQLGSDSATRETRGAKEQTRILSLALYAMSLIIGIIGALGVLNTLTLNVLERRREIGVLRALGASDANLIVAFLSEGLALGFIGWVVGVLLGYPLGLFFTGLMQAVLFHIDYVFSAPMVGASLAFALVISGAASLIPALGAARLRVGQVLRYE